MATVVAPIPHISNTAGTATQARTRSLSSRMVTAIVASCVVIFALTFALSMTLPVPLVANFGFAFFLTFWLGGGFGLIAAGSSIADHLH